jgi:hypothetical protein
VEKLKELVSLLFRQVVGTDFLRWCSHWCEIDGAGLGGICGDGLNGPLSQAVARNIAFRPLSLSPAVRPAP